MSGDSSAAATLRAIVALPWTPRTTGPRSTRGPIPGRCSRRFPCSPACRSTSSTRPSPNSSGCRCRAGRLLFEAGSPADAVYFVVSGCLGVYGPGGELVGRIAAGETVGEMGLIVSRPRRATVRALRDSELAMLSAGTFERVLLGHPQAILRLARLTVSRIDDRDAERQRVMTPRTIALIPLDESRGPAAARAAGSSMRSPASAASISSGAQRAGSHSPQWFHERESQNDFVVYTADAGDTPWTRLCLQAGRRRAAGGARGRRGARLGRPALAGRRHAPRPSSCCCTKAGSRTARPRAGARRSRACRITTCAAPPTTTGWCAC